MYSIKRSRGIRTYHVAVLQRQLRNVQKSVMHLENQSCFDCISLLLFPVLVAVAVVVA